MNQLQLKGTQPFMGKDIPVVLGGFGPKQKCICDKTIAEIHGQPVSEIRKSVTRNITRFREKVDCIDLVKRRDEVTTLEILLSMGYSKQAITQADHIYLLSERGYAKLIKIMDTDLAWEIHDKLVDEYFELREGARNSLPKSKRKYAALPSVNHSVEILRKAWSMAGVDEKRAAAAVTDIYQQVYKDEGIDIPGLPVQVDQTYDKEQIAKKLGILSKAGRPHSQAVGAIIRDLAVPADMIEHSPFAKNGHDDDYDRYKAPVMDMARDWLDKHDWPKTIDTGTKKFSVNYTKN